MAKRVHVVLGSSGEYSDHREWPVIAFEDERDAADLVKRLDAAVKNLPEWDDDVDWTKWNESLKAVMAKAGDPDYQHDSSGARYSYFTIDVRRPSRRRGGSR